MAGGVELGRLIGGALLTAGVFALVSTAVAPAHAATLPPPPPPPPRPPSPDAPTVQASAMPPLSGAQVVPGGSLMQASRPGHVAVDIGAREGTPVYAALAGTVRGVWPNGRLLGGGNTVAISHTDRDDGSVYMHLAWIRPGLRPGVRVARGELLGTVGRTDSSPDDGLFSVSGPHLHLAVMGPLARPEDIARFRDGFPARLDPVAWAREVGVQLGSGRGLR